MNVNDAASQLGIEIRQSGEQGTVGFYDRTGRLLLNWHPPSREWWTDDESGTADNEQLALAVAASMKTKAVESANG